jgi:hypothetical protein
MKHPVHSRTIWAVILVRLTACFWPGALDLVREYPEAYLLIDGILIVLLRLVTKTPLQWKRDNSIVLRRTYE